MKRENSELGQWSRKPSDYSIEEEVKEHSVEVGAGVAATRRYKPSTF
jgi:hypothetical protein